MLLEAGLAEFFKVTSHAAEQMWEDWPRTASEMGRFAKEGDTEAAAKGEALARLAEVPMEALRKNTAQIRELGTYPETLLGEKERLDAQVPAIESLQTAGRTKESGIVDRSALERLKTRLDFVSEETKTEIPRYVGLLASYAINYERANEMLEKCAVWLAGNARAPKRA